MEDGYTAHEAMTAQQALRDALCLPPERFPLAAFVGMLSDEIEQLRAAGHGDDAIAALVAQATGKPLTAADITRHYASSERRHG